MMVLLILGHESVKGDMCGWHPNKKEGEPLG
jgi:hypothetical protein